MNDSQLPDLQRLMHDIRSPFSIISMGIEALRALRDDEEQFQAMCQTIEQEGIDKLRERLDALPDQIAKLLHDAK
jgi:hypothetical protein